MITINESDKSVTVTDSEGDMVRIDGNEYQLANGGISVVNLPSYFDVEVFKKVEENHIERPIPEPIEEFIIEEPIIEEEPLP
jgi:hypothetical protein